MQDFHLLFDKDNKDEPISFQAKRPRFAESKEVFACYQGLPSPDIRCREFPNASMLPPLSGRKLYATEQECLAACDETPEELAEEIGVYLTPTADYSFDEKKVQAYLDGFCTKIPQARKQREAAEAVIRATEIISFAKFKKMLRKAIEEFLKAYPTLERLNWEPYPRFGSVMKKSNAWVVTMAFHMVPFLYNASQFSRDPSKPPDLIVFFDDALYSGTQMSENVGNIIVKTFEKFGSKIVDLDIAVVVAYASKEGVAKVVQQVKSLQAVLPENVTLDLGIFKGATLVPIHSKIRNKSLAKNIWKTFGGGIPRNIKTVYPYIFYHKMADGFSSFPQVYSGYIPALPYVQGPPEREKKEKVAAATEEEEEEEESEFEVEVADDYEKVEEKIEAKVEEKGEEEVEEESSSDESNSDSSNENSNNKTLTYQEVKRLCPQRLEPQVIPYLNNCFEIFQVGLAGKNVPYFESSDIECPTPPYKREEEEKKLEKLKVLRGLKAPKEESEEVEAEEEVEEEVEEFEGLQQVEEAEPSKPSESLQPLQPLELLEPLEGLEPLEPFKGFEGLEGLQGLEPFQPLETEPSDPSESSEPFEPLELLEPLE